MKKNLILLAMMVIALMGLLLPANAEYKSYIFKEDFDNTTLDNQTWVNLSDPFPYEIKDGHIIIHFDPDPLYKYAESKPTDFSLDKIHGEINFKIYTSRYQNNSAYASVILGTSFVKNTDNMSLLDYRKHETYSKILISNSIFIGGRFSYYLYANNKFTSVSESYDFLAYSFGREIPMKYVFDIEMDNVTGQMLVYQKIYKENYLMLANKEYLNEQNKTMIVDISVEKNSATRPIDGYVTIDSIHIGDYVESTSTKQVEPYRYMLSSAIMMLKIASIFLFFHDRSELVEIIGVVAFYFTMVLFFLFFLTYPEPIFGIPTWIYSLFPLSILLVGMVKVEKDLFKR